MHFMKLIDIKMMSSNHLLKGILGQTLYPQKLIYRCINVISRDVKQNPQPTYQLMPSSASHSITKPRLSLKVNGAIGTDKPMMNGFSIFDNMLVLMTSHDLNWLSFRFNQSCTCRAIYTEIWVIV